MFKSDHPLSPEITEEQYQEFENKIQEYFDISNLIRKTE